MRIVLYTNTVAGGWDPRQVFGTGLGGSEECVVLLAEALAHVGHDVTVYGSHVHATSGVIDDTTASGVRYRQRERFDLGDSPDVLITWKDFRPYLMGASAGMRVHWSSDVEAPWPTGVLAPLDRFICLTSYHAGRMPWIPAEKLRIFPHGIGSAYVTGSKKRAERPDRGIYCSSPDRGLLTLLQDWETIRRNFPDLELLVTYGWEHYNADTAGSPEAAQFKHLVLKLLEQPGIRYVGKLVDEHLRATLPRCRYWFLPLSRADSELFCLSAVKAQKAGCLPVVLRADDSGLADTVGDHIPYARFRRGSTEIVRRPRAARVGNTWAKIVEDLWQPLLTGEEHEQATLGDLRSRHAV